MENMKQLVLVPPMSEPLQKLHEVLNGISVDESIEISLIDDSLELNQFIGSSDQCLVLFSNAKKCAVFLQENRLELAKNHTKVILLSAKEIPTKTLSKFLKLGLTDSILETSPPKTLLYKIKLLLRSIRSTSLTPENKDQIIKNTNTDAPVAKKEENAQKESEENLNNLGEDRLKNKKKNGKQESVEEEGPLKGKSNYTEAAIDSNWASKRKKDAEKNSDNGPEDLKTDSTNNKSEDLYYRGLTKKKSETELEEEKNRNKRITLKTVADDLGEKKRKNIDLQLDPADVDKDKSNYIEEEEGDLRLQKKNHNFDLEEDEPITKNQQLSEIEKAEKQKKELEELEEIIEEAKKRHAENASDLAGHYKGKVSKSEEEINNDFTDEKENYDNSEKNKKNKNINLELIETPLEKPQEMEDEEDNGKDPFEGQVDKINTNMTSDNGKADRINTLMHGQFEKNNQKDNTLDDSQNEDRDKENKKNEEDEDDKKDKDETKQNSKKDNNNKKGLDLTEENADLHSKSDLNLEDEKNSSDLNKKELEVNLEDEKNSRKKMAKIELVDDDREDELAMNKNKNDLSLNRKNDIDLDLENNDKKKTHTGKVEKVDSFYRGLDNKKNEQNWDNLNNKDQSTNYGNEKGPRSKNNDDQNTQKDDAGETTIDYRKLKKEFDNISKNKTSREEEEEVLNKNKTNNLNNSEDSGTFKVIEIDARGFEFSIDIVNLIYQKDSKAIDFYKKISMELITQYKAFPLFYSYKTTTQQHTESFDSFNQFDNSVISQELKEWWDHTKSDQELFKHYFEKSMTTWICRTIPDKSGNGHFWEDVELPSWANNELRDKKVEMVFPYFDGIERMGTAVLFFPEGVNSSKEKSIMVTLELLRTIFLDSIQRKNASKNEPLSTDHEKQEVKNNIVSMFSGLFKRNKAS